MTTCHTTPSSLPSPEAASPAHRSAPRWHWARLLVAGSPLLLAACNPTPLPSSADAGAAVDYASKGTFQCHVGHPWQAIQVAASVEVPAGGNAPVSVQTPPEIPAGLTPDRMYLFCQADGQKCTGNSCNGNPPVDFIGQQGNGLTWQASRAPDGSTKVVFTAMAHNSDKENAHEVTLTLDIGAN
jgi:hypothetical protein